MPRSLVVSAFLLLVALSGSMAAAQPIPLFDAAFRTGPYTMSPPGVVSGDVNGDGHDDLIAGTSQVYASSSFRARIGVLPGRGDGTFGPPIEFDPGESVFAIQVVDVDGNGTLDLLSAGRFNGFSVQLGLGNGSFGPPRSLSVGEDIGFLAAGDVTGDSLPDAILVGRYSRSLFVFINSGDGNFSPRPAVTAPDAVYGVAVGHLDPDSLGDLVVASRSGELGRILTYRSLGDGSFSLVEDRIIAGDQRGIVCLDLDGDGIDDVAAAPDRAPQISVLLGSGDDRFRPTVEFSSGGGAEGILACDKDGDHKTDLVIVNDNATVSVLRGLGNGGFQASVESPGPFTVQSSISSAAADWNEDGFEDVWFGGYIFRGAAGGAYGRESCGRTSQSLSRPGDVTGDGFVDVVAVDLAGQPLRVFSGNGDGTFAPFGECPINVYPTGLRVGDVNQDGIADMVLTAEFGGGELITFFGGASPNSCTPVYTADPQGVGTDPQMVDFDEDGRADLVTARGDALILWKGNGDGTFVSTSDLPSLPESYNVRLADLDRDGKVDLIALSQRGGVSTYRGLGGFQFGARSDVTSGQNADEIVVADWTADGYPDVLVSRKTRSGTTFLFPGNGNGTLGPGQPLLPSLALSGEMLAGDFDDDGMMDLATSNGPVVVIWRGHGNATFDLLEADGAAGYGTLDSLDADGNGRTDLLTRSGGQSCVIPSRIPSLPMPVIDALVDSTSSTVITWHGSMGPGIPGDVYRRVGNGEWAPRAALTSDASGKWILDDTTAQPGVVYDYRFFLSGRLVSELQAHVPRPPSLALDAIQPNPTRIPVQLTVALPLGEGWLQVFDFRGREILSRDLGALGPGRHTIEIPEASTWPSGVYRLRLVQGNLDFGVDPEVKSASFILLR